MTFDEFADAVRLLQHEYSLSVTSWFRTPARNAAKGGVPNSRHLDGLAVDVVLDDKGKTEALIARAQALGLRTIDENDHVHIQVRR